MTTGALCFGENAVERNLENTLKKNHKQKNKLLSESEPVLEGLRMGEVGVWRWKIDADELRWTDNLEALHKLPEGSFDGTLSAFKRDIHPGDAENVWRAIATAIADGSHYRTAYRTAPRDGFEPIWIEASGGLTQDSRGEKYLTGICMDVTERIRKDEELERRLRQQQSIGRFGTFALEEHDFQKILDKAVHTACEIFEVPLAKILQFADDADHLVLRAGHGWKKGFVGSARVSTGKETQAGFTLANNGPVIVHDLLTETRFQGTALLHDHGVRSGMSVVIPGPEMRPFGIFGIHTLERRLFDQHDVDYLVALANIVASSARHHAAAEQKTLMIREMAHRAGNMLQLVSAIANQTFSEGREYESAKNAFTERLASLSRANYLVARGGWVSTRFISLLEEILGAFKDRILFRGRDILLPPDFCFDFGLVVNELSTNSVKYGSLASESGKVTLTWKLVIEDDGRQLFSFEWSDPEAAPAPVAIGSGFGSKLKRALIEHKWKGEMTIERENGYRFSCVVHLPAQ